MLRVVGCLPLRTDVMIRLNLTGRRRTSLEGGNRGMFRGV